MSNPFAAGTAPEIQSDDPWVWYSQVTLVVVGVAYILLGVGFGLAFPGIAAEDPEVDPVAGMIMGVFMAVFCVAFAIPNFITAWGLGQRAKWSWYATIVLGALYAPSACLPFGLVLMYGMLNDRTRKAFLG